MKQLFIYAMAGWLAVACQTGPSRLGVSFTEQHPMSVDELVSSLRQKKELKQVQLAGKIDKNCMDKGCWLSMKAADGSDVMMTFRDDKFTIPINSLGKEIVAIGDASMKQDSVDGKWVTEYNFVSAGLMFK